MPCSAHISSQNLRLISLPHCPVAKEIISLIALLKLSHSLSSFFCIHSELSVPCINAVVVLSRHWPHGTGISLASFFHGKSKNNACYVQWELNEFPFCCIFDKWLKLFSWYECRLLCACAVKMRQISMTYILSNEKYQGQLRSYFENIERRWKYFININSI